MNSRDNSPNAWVDDRLSREEISHFLTRLTDDRFNRGKTGSAHSASGGLCFALDGDWGTGKTFFVTRWIQDLRSTQHPVVLFDAWENDLSQDPLLGFVAELNIQLKRWTKELSVGEDAKRQIQSSLKTVIKKSGRALPAIGKLVLRAGIKKITGLATDEIEEALASQESKDHEKDSDSPQGFGTGILEQSIDKVFEAELDQYLARTRAIAELKQSMSKLLDLLDEKAKIRIPLFIVIDELDRCRPDYAIELLEGIKHLFSVPRVCFVVSTNIRQLTESIRSVYGSGFDAYRYLKRFFAFEYTLPPPDNERFAELLIAPSFLTSFGSIVSGMPNWQKDETNEIKLKRSFGWVADGFRLDLRSQQQVFDIAQHAAAGLKPLKPLHALYLFSLSAIQHLHSGLLVDLLASGNESLSVLDQIRTLIDSRNTRDFEVDRFVQNRTKAIRRKISINEVLERYVDWSRQDLKDLINEQSTNNPIEYPVTLIRSLTSELAGGYMTNQAYPTPIHEYARLVIRAGEGIST